MMLLHVFAYAFSVRIWTVNFYWRKFTMNGNTHSWWFIIKLQKVSSPLYDFLMWIKLHILLSWSVVITSGRHRSQWNYDGCAGWTGRGGSTKTKKVHSRSHGRWFFVAPQALSMHQDTLVCGLVIWRTFLWWKNSFHLLTGVSHAPALSGKSKYFLISGSSLCFIRFQSSIGHRPSASSNVSRRSAASTFSTRKNLRATLWSIGQQSHGQNGLPEST